MYQESAQNFVDHALPSSSIYKFTTVGGSNEQRAIVGFTTKQREHI